MSSDTALVTGAAGFVGSHLVDRLLESNYRVTCLVRSGSNIGALDRSRVRLVVGDLGDPEALRDAVRSARTIYHAAGKIKAARREEYFQVNQAGTRMLLEAAARSSLPPARFVHFSSLAAAGPCPSERGRTEDDAPCPVSWYGESKLRSEEEVLACKGLFPVTILRPPAVYGPRDRETLLVFRMVQRGWLFAPWGPERIFSLIHVRDLVDAAIRAGEHPDGSGEVFFVSGPESHSWKALADAIAGELGRRYRRIPLPAWLAAAAGRAGDCWSRSTGRATTINSQKVKELFERFWVCDSAKFRAKLGFSPKIDLPAGVRESVAWYRGHGWL